uniref:C-X-C motif chemokine n=2 Tax=Equus TaxID=9789 RepID=A0A9L0JZS3_EQUAS
GCTESFLKSKLLLLWFQPCSLDGDEKHLAEGSVPQEKLAFLALAGPGEEISAGLLFIPGGSSSSVHRGAGLQSGPVAAAVRELRCMCLTVTPGIHPKMISSLQVFAVGPQCSKVEVVATLKNKKEVCLDPEAPLIKKFIQKTLDSGNKKN